MNRHPASLRVGQTCFLMVFHAILGQLSDYCFFAIFSCEILLVFSCVFSNYGQELNCMGAVIKCSKLKCSKLIELERESHKKVEAAVKIWCNQTKGKKGIQFPGLGGILGGGFYINTPSPWRLGCEKITSAFFLFLPIPLLFKWKNYLIGHYFKFAKKNKKQTVAMVQLLCPYLLWTSYSAGENPF